MGEFSGKVVLVTGAGTGIGRATAVAFARAGATVVVSTRREAEGARTVEVIARNGGTARFVPADVSNAQDVEGLVDATTSAFGRLDVAYNNAGYQEPRSLLADQREETYARVFDANVKGLFLCMKYELAPMMRARRGVIVNCTSVSAVRNMYPGIALYAASKSAALSLTRSAAMEYAAHGIRINGVAPGRIHTEMLARSTATDLERFAEALPLKRLGTPDEVASAVLWLASDQAAFVTGHTLAVDGGFLAT